MADRRLLIIGFDAMDVELVRRWADAGYLPTFRRLLESAAWTEVWHPPEITSGSIFPCLHTGLGPLRHGSLEHLLLRDDSYRIRLGSAADVKGDPFWKSFAREGRRIVVVDVPFMIPREEYGGKQVSGWGVHYFWTWNRTSVPGRLLRGLLERCGAHPVRTCFHYSTETDSLRRLKAGLLTGTSRRTAMFKSMIQSPEWDLFYGVYSEAHCAGHLMWHLEDDGYPQHRPEQLATVGHGLREVYEALDRALEELLSIVGADTICAVLLSHGMGPNHHGGHLFPELVSRFLHRRAGTRPASNSDRAKGTWVDTLWKASVQSIPDRWRRSVRKHLPGSLDTWLYIRRIEQAGQWSRALAFPLPTVGPSLLRVNLAGRDPRGRIRQGEEYSLFLDAFIQELSQMTNADTGEPAVDRIFRTDRQVDPAKIGTSADLIVWWSKSAPVRMIRSPSLGLIRGESRDIRTGEHVMRGALFLLHTSARPGRYVIEGMTPMDIPATLCELGGIRPGTELDGVSRLGNFLAK